MENLIVPTKKEAILIKNLRGQIKELRKTNSKIQEFEKQSSEDAAKIFKLSVIIEQRDNLLKEKDERIQGLEDRINQDANIIRERDSQLAAMQKRLDLLEGE